MLWPLQRATVAMTVARKRFWEETGSTTNEPCWALLAQFLQNMMSLFFLFRVAFAMFRQLSAIDTCPAIATPFEPKGWLQMTTANRGVKTQRGNRRKCVLLERRWNIHKNSLNLNAPCICNCGPLLLACFSCSISQEQVNKQVFLECM